MWSQACLSLFLTFILTIAQKISRMKIRNCSTNVINPLQKLMCHSLCERALTGEILWARGLKLYYVADKMPVKPHCFSICSPLFGVISSYFRKFDTTSKKADF